MQISKKAVLGLISLAAIGALVYHNTPKTPTLSAPHFAFKQSNLKKSGATHYANPDPTGELIADVEAIDERVTQEYLQNTDAIKIPLSEKVKIVFVESKREQSDLKEVWDKVAQGSLTITKRDLINFYRGVHPDDTEEELIVDLQRRGNWWAGNGTITLGDWYVLGDWIQNPEKRRPILDYSQVEFDGYLERAEVILNGHEDYHGYFRKGKTGEAAGEAKKIQERDAFGDNFLRLLWTKREDNVIYKLEDLRKFLKTHFKDANAIYWETSARDKLNQVAYEHTLIRLGIETLQPHVDLTWQECIVLWFRLFDTFQ